MPHRSFRLPRLRMNRVISELAPLFDGDVINVSAWDDRDKEGRTYRDYFSKASTYSTSNHEGERGVADAADVSDYALDLTAELPKELTGKFDVVFNHTTLEHIFDVTTAFHNLCLMTRDVVIVVVPFAQEMHYNESYGDFWRFTPMVMHRLFESNGLSVVFEAANDDSNAGLYVLTVGSRDPDKWRDRLPDSAPVEQLGKWIGATWRDRTRATASKFAKTIGAK
ncbi:MAG: hypothetical protein AAFX06_08640 [Planctomycetota bacterium]